MEDAITSSSETASSKLLTIDQLKVCIERLKGFIDDLMPELQAHMEEIFANGEW